MSNIDEILNSLKTGNETTKVEATNTSKLDNENISNIVNSVKVENTETTESTETQDDKDAEMVALFRKLEQEHKVNIADFNKIIVPNPPDIPEEMDSNDTTLVDNQNIQNIQNVDFESKAYKDPFYDRNEGFPYKYEIQERYKFLYDDYLFRIPFSKSLPKKIYEGILGWEIFRKMVNTKEYKVPDLVAYKNVQQAIEQLNGTRDINHILKVFNRYKFPLKRTDFKDIPYKEEPYDTFPVGEVFKDELPDNVTPDEIKEYNEIKSLVLNYKEQRDQGYYSPEGRIFAKDLVKVPEDIKPDKVRNSEWLMFQNIEKWEERVKVIRKQTMSLGEAKEKGIYEADKKAEEERWRAKDHTFRPHPTDPNFIYIDNILCERIKSNEPQFANQTEKYPFKKDSSTLTMDEREDLDNQYVNEVLTYEEELKDLKRNFKDRRDYYKLQGVKVIQIDKAVRKLKTEIKKNPQMEKEVDEIYAKLVGNSEVMNRLTMLNIA